MRTHLFQSAILAGVLSISSVVLAADDSSPILMMHDQRFDPDKLIVPAGIRVKIVLRNLDSIPNEFESYDLAREVLVPGHSEVPSMSARLIREPT